MEKQIQKRNGDLVPFDSIKILNAIHRAGLASDDHLTPADLSYLTQKSATPWKMWRFPPWNRFRISWRPC